MPLGVEAGAADIRGGIERAARIGFRCANPGGAFYAFPNVSGTGFDAKGLQTRLLDEASVATIAGTSFGAFGEGYLRFSYASSLPQLGEAVERIRRFLGNAPPLVDK